MTKPDGKYIVFCSGREHMDEMKAQAADWLARWTKSHTYTQRNYNDASTSKAFADEEVFESYDPMTLETIKEDNCADLRW